MTSSLNKQQREQALQAFLTKVKKQREENTQDKENENVHCPREESPSQLKNQQPASHQSSSSKVKQGHDRQLLQKHLQQYEDWMQQQPRRHTEQQLRQERLQLQEEMKQREKEQLQALRLQKQEEFRNTKERRNNQQSDQGFFHMRLLPTDVQQRPTSVERDFQRTRDSHHVRSTRDPPSDYRGPVRVPLARVKPNRMSRKMASSPGSSPEANHVATRTVPAPPPSVNVWQARREALAELTPANAQEEEDMLKKALAISRQETHAGFAEFEPCIHFNTGYACNCNSDSPEAHTDMEQTGPAQTFNSEAEGNWETLADRLQDHHNHEAEPEPQPGQDATPPHPTTLQDFTGYAEDQTSPNGLDDGSASQSHPHRATSVTMATTAPKPLHNEEGANEAGKVELKLNIQQTTAAEPTEPNDGVWSCTKRDLAEIWRQPIPSHAGEERSTSPWSSPPNDLPAENQDSSCDVDQHDSFSEIWNPASSPDSEPGSNTGGSADTNSCVQFSDDAINSMPQRKSTSPADHQEYPQDHASSRLHQRSPVMRQPSPQPGLVPRVIDLWDNISPPKPSTEASQESRYDLLEEDAGIHDCLPQEEEDKPWIARYVEGYDEWPDTTPSGKTDPAQDADPQETQDHTPEDNEDLESQKDMPENAADGSKDDLDEDSQPVACSSPVHESPAPDHLPVTSGVITSPYIYPHFLPMSYTIPAFTTGMPAALPFGMMPMGYPVTMGTPYYNLAAGVPYPMHMMAGQMGIPHVNPYMHYMYQQQEDLATTPDDLKNNDDNDESTPDQQGIVDGVAEESAASEATTVEANVCEVTIDENNNDLDISDRLNELALEDRHGPHVESHDSMAISSSRDGMNAYVMDRSNVVSEREDGVISGSTAPEENLPVEECQIPERPRKTKIADHNEDSHGKEAQKDDPSPPKRSRYGPRASRKAVRKNLGETQLKDDRKTVAGAGSEECGVDMNGVEQKDDPQAVKGDTAPDDTGCKEERPSTSDKEFEGQSKAFVSPETETWDNVLPEYPQTGATDFEAPHSSQRDSIKAENKMDEGLSIPKYKKRVSFGHVEVKDLPLVEDEAHNAQSEQEHWSSRAKKPCKYGIRCRFGAKCPFSHPARESIQRTRVFTPSRRWSGGQSGGSSVERPQHSRMRFNDRLF